MSVIHVSEFSARRGLQANRFLEACDRCPSVHNDYGTHWPSCTDSGAKMAKAIKTRRTSVATTNNPTAMRSIRRTSAQKKGRDWCCSQRETLECL